ncbi:MAG: ABC transporter ATP-binding protein [Solirubrobacterales bacterium]
MAAPQDSALNIYRRVFGEARPYRLQVGAILFLGLLSTPLALLAPVPIAIAVDSVLGDHPLPGFIAAPLPAAVSDSKDAILLLAAALVVFVAFLAALRGLASGVLREYTGQRLVRDFRAKLFRHTQRLSLSFHDAKGTSHSIYRIQYDAPALQWIAIDGVIPFVTSTVKLMTMIVIVAMIDWQLAMVALVISPLLFLVTRSSSHRLRRGWKQAKRVDSSLMAVVQETLGAIRVVKAFGQEDREQERFAGRSNEWVARRTRLAFSEGVFGLLTGLVVAAGTATVLYAGVQGVRSGRLTLGELLLIMAYLSSLYSPLQKISEKIGDLQSSLVSAERTFSLLDETPDVVERPHARSLSRAAGRVTFDRVSFAYNGADPVLEDISFEVEPGTGLGVSGATGAGKTTLVSLLTRFYDPAAGRILLDGVDLRDYRLADLRNQFAIVLQEPVLFSTSVAENIAYARPGASEREVRRAAEAAGAADFIAALPDGYETRVGERGMRLSGGERQRVSLARAFLKDAPILILDEPTSSVDVETEAQIIAAMEELMRERTALMIAHRLGTLDRCEARLEIAGGRLVGPLRHRAEGAALAETSA